SVVTPTTVGSVNVKITSVGAFSGTLQFPAFPTIPIHGKLNPNGLAAFSPATYNGHQIIVNLTLPLDSTARTLQGLVGQAGIWTANLFAYRQNSGLGTNTVPTPGKYVLLFVPPALTTNGPTASGYGLATIDSDGNLTMAGAMPDGATFTESANVSDYGYWPAFFVPSGYQKRGMVVGWEFFHAPGTNSIITNSAFSAIDWVKLKGVGPTYTGGFGMAMTSPGGQFIPPAPNTQYSFIFSGGNLTNSITNLVTVDVNGNFADSPVTSGLSLSADGQLSGNFSNPQTGETLSLQGGFINPLLGGGGFVPDNSGTSEGFLIQPVH
ncbi:MAG TPA: hypothetical protein VGI75_02030, partial [Pirellulales bacterium]